MKHLDKAHHVVWSFALAFAGAFLFGPEVGSVLALCVGTVKEIVWDGVLRRGDADVLDMAANCVGVFAAVLIMRGWGV